ncbi:Polyadenylate-binding protein 2-B [Linum perenne]
MISELLQANSEDLRKFFADVGGVVSIRILHDKFTGKSRGLAYVDFSDDEHLAAALAKNKQTFLGKKLSIARSNPKKGKKGAHASERVNDGGSAPKLNETADDLRKAEVSRPTGSRQSEDVQLKGKNTFAVPRNMVKPLGWSDKQPKCIEEGDEQPKSNDEFRKLFIKG